LLLGPLGVPPKPVLTTVDPRIDEFSIVLSSIEGAPKFARAPPSTTLKLVLEKPTLMLSPKSEMTFGNSSA